MNTFAALIIQKKQKMEQTAQRDRLPSSLSRKTDLIQLRVGLREICAGDAFFKNFI